MKNILLALLTLTIFTISCDDAPTTDASGPTIEIMKPVQSNGGEYFVDTNNVIEILAKITDNDELHNINLVVTNSYAHGNGETVVAFDETYHEHANSFTLDKTFTIDTACHSNFYIKVIASDHNNNVTRDSVKVHVHGRKGVMVMCQ